MAIFLEYHFQFIFGWANKLGYLYKGEEKSISRWAGSPTNRSRQSRAFILLHPQKPQSIPSVAIDRVGANRCDVPAAFCAEGRDGGGVDAGGAAAVKVKETTEIVGLDVVPNAREVLISLYTRTLKEIQVVPEDEGYRKAVESFTRHRLQACQEEEDWEEIEKRLGCGQVEELIVEAQDELKLIAMMIEWEPWGVPEDYECEVIEDDTPIPKHVPQHRPCTLPEEFFKTMEAVTGKSVPESESAPQLKT